jgi:hypothetical protein
MFLNVKGDYMNNIVEIPGACDWYGLLFLVALAIIFVRKSRFESGKKLIPVIPFSAQSGELALSELENSAPHLFQLRKVGVEFSLSNEVRQSLLTVNDKRAKKVFSLIDGQVVL